MVEYEQLYGVITKNTQYLIGKMYLAVYYR